MQRVAQLPSDGTFQSDEQALAQHLSPAGNGARPGGLAARPAGNAVSQAAPKEDRQ
jgi:hypothetical protein